MRSRNLIINVGIILEFGRKEFWIAKFLWKPTFMKIDTCKTSSSFTILFLGIFMMGSAIIDPWDFIHPLIKRFQVSIIFENGTFSHVIMLKLFGVRTSNCHLTGDV